MRLIVSLMFGAVGFFAMAIILITLKESVDNPLIAIAALVMGLVVFAGSYVIDVLTTRRE